MQVTPFGQRDEMIGPAPQFFGFGARGANTLVLK
jgi:hypothetical protein